MTANLSDPSFLGSARPSPSKSTGSITGTPTAGGGGPSPPPPPGSRPSSAHHASPAINKRIGTTVTNVSRSLWDGGAMLANDRGLENPPTVSKSTFRYESRGKVAVIPHCVIAHMNKRVGKRKGAQQREREGAQRLQLALSAGQLGDWSWDAASDRVTLGPRAAECFGLSGTAPITWTAMRELLHPADREMAREAIEAALLNHTDYDFEYRVMRLDGSEVWIAAKGRGLYADDGSAEGMIGVVQDVTERKRLELIQNRMAAVVESSDDAIISKDLTGIVQTWNSGAERIFGYSATE